MAEILRCEADIVCLQEVDHFQDFFEPMLSRYGYEGYFVPKTKGFDRIAETEGQAIFVWTERFSVQQAICWTSIDLRSGKWRKHTNKWKSQIKPSPGIFQIVYGREAALEMMPQVALGLFLQSKESHQSILATCMHLKSKPAELPDGMKEAELKKVQCLYFLTSVIDASTLWAPNMPVLCAGDFNIHPTKHTTEAEALEGFAEAIQEACLVDTYASGPERLPRNSSETVVDFILVTSANLDRVKSILEVVLSEPPKPKPENYPSDHVIRAAELSIGSVQGQTFDRSPTRRSK